MSTPTQEAEEGSESEDDDDGDLSSDMMTEDESEDAGFVILDEIDNVQSPLNVYYCPWCKYKTDFSNVEEIQDHEAQHDQDVRRDLNLGEFKKKYP